jgi:putative endonuclease
MASGRNGTLYTGVTSALAARVSQHKRGVFEGFSKTHGRKRLVWYETHPTMLDAIAREKQIKRWRRAWKLALIEAENPQWRDLSEAWFEVPEGPLFVDAARVGDRVEAGVTGSRLFALWRALRPG